MQKASIVTAGQTRVWLIEQGPGPSHEPVYQGSMKIGDSTWAAGDITPIRVPSPDKFGAFLEAGEVRSGEERATTSIVARYPEQASTLLGLRRKLCRVDIHVPIGKCANPQDYQRSWEKMRIYRDAQVTSWSDENAGALDSDEQAATNETGEFSAEEIFEVTKLTLDEVAASEATRELLFVEICDSQNCGDCGKASTGCQKIFIGMVGVGATPGTLPSILYSDDGGSTWATTDIDTMFSSENPTDGACVGDYLVVVTNEGNELHYALSQNIVDGTEVWAQVDTGFVVGGEPSKIFSLSSQYVWIVGNGGYVYFTSDFISGVSVQDAGVATTQDLKSVHGYDSQNVLAGGELNSLIYTRNGGSTWQAATGPAVGETLRAVWMLSEDTWIVGTNTGKLYYTENAGTSWTLKGLPGTVDNIDAISFVDDTVGYIAARQGTRGYILRTTNGGYSWYILPETGAAIPANDNLNDVAACKYDHNFVVGAGLADDATTGFAVIGS
jgi:photosystem II stability/assembly factor-like uncharacterized protein